MNWLIDFLIRRSTGQRTIMARDGKTPYLTRYFIFRHSAKSEGMDRHDNPPKWGLYLHCFHQSDDDGALHNHPWRWAASLILKGGYSEERRVGDEVIRFPYYPGSVNVLTNKDYHRVDLYESEAWSLFLVGPIVQSWGFWDRVSGKHIPWKEFLADKLAEARRAVDDFNEGTYNGRGDR